MAQLEDFFGSYYMWPRCVTQVVYSNFSLYVRLDPASTKAFTKSIWNIRHTPKGN